MRARTPSCPRRASRQKGWARRAAGWARRRHAAGAPRRPAVRVLGLRADMGDAVRAGRGRRTGAIGRHPRRGRAPEPGRRGRGVSPAATRRGRRARRRRLLMSAPLQLAAQPFDLAGLRLRNRIVGTAHGRGLVEDGLALPGDAEYWRRRAAGGAAMLTVGGTVTAPESTWRKRITTEAWRPEAVPGFAARAEAIRSEGAVAAAQIVHLGRETLGLDTWYHPVGPSAVRSPREPTRPRALRDEDLDVVVEGFRRSAVHAAEAGYQVVELHAAHGYLLAQFLSAMTNRRPGEEGPAGRTRLVARIAAAIRASAPGLVLGIRLSIDGGEEAGFTLDGLCELLPHVEPLVDYVNITAGVRATYVRDMGTPAPPLLEHVRTLRTVVAKPLLISQAFRTGAAIEAALAAGADLVGMARPLIADPDLPRKLLAGRAEE